MGVIVYMFITIYDDKFMLTLKNKDLKNYKYDLIQEIKKADKYEDIRFLVHEIEKIDKIIYKRKIKPKKNIKGEV